MAIVNMQVTFTLETNMTTEQVTAALKDMVDNDAFHNNHGDRAMMFTCTAIILLSLTIPATYWLLNGE